MRLFLLLPDPAYNSEPHVIVFQDALGRQVSALQGARDDMLMQARPATATSWGMAKYERGWGLVVDESKPMDQRLAAWRAKRRGVGTTTVSTLKNIAESFFRGYPGHVEINEHKKDFWVEIVFSSYGGGPPNMADLHYAVDEVIPAHMEVIYIIRIDLEATGAAYLGVCGTQSNLETYEIIGSVGELSPPPVDEYAGAAYGESAFETHTTQ